MSHDPTPAEWDEIKRQDLRSERERLKLRLMHIEAERQDTEAALDDITARLAVLHRSGEDQ